MIEFLFLFLLLGAYADLPDYEKPYSPIFTDKSVYSWTDKVKITIISPSWNTDNHLVDSIGSDADHPIKISTRDHFLDQYKFTETAVNSGIFTAEVILTGFPHDVDGDGRIDTQPRTFGNGPTSGFLETDRDSAITISFEFSDRIILTESVPINWNLGKIQFFGEQFFSNQTAHLRVIDSDMNLNPETLDRVLVTISSDSDAAGIEVDAIETSENSGIFATDISFSHNQFSSGARLFAVPGNSIYAKYVDYTLPKPYALSDHLEIVSIAKLDSNIQSIHTIENSQIILSDSSGNQLDSVSKNNQIQIVGTIRNESDFTQPFVYLFQIKDADNLVVDVSWIQGEISQRQILDVSQSWNAVESGEYHVETFVWKSLKEMTPLSNPQHTEIIVK